MRPSIAFSAIILLAWLVSTVEAAAAPAKIIKVLPQFVDRNGRTALAPSLYERDAYQVRMRRDSTRRAGMRFNVQWRARGYQHHPLTLRVEVRGANVQAQFRPATYEKAVMPRRWFTRWSVIPIDEEEFTNLGEVIAWRVALRDGDQELADLKSFLW